MLELLIGHPEAFELEAAVPDTRSPIVSATASGCSKISFSMNVSKPPFSAPLVVPVEPVVSCATCSPSAAAGCRSRLRASHRRCHRRQGTGRSGSRAGRRRRSRQEIVRPRRARLRAALQPCAHEQAPGGRDGSRRRRSGPRARGTRAAQLPRDPSSCASIRCVTVSASVLEANVWPSASRRSRSSRRSRRCR